MKQFAFILLALMVSDQCYAKSVRKVGTVETIVSEATIEKDRQEEERLRKREQASQKEIVYERWMRFYSQMEASQQSQVEKIAFWLNNQNAPWATVEEMIRDYEENEIRADEKYTGSLIAVGTITAFSKDSDGNPLVYLDHTVKCFFDKSFRLNIGNLNQNSFVAVHGNFVGKKFFQSLHLEDCDGLKLIAE